MTRTRVLNPAPAATRLEAVDLSRQILAEAREIPGPSQCARLDALAAQLHGVAPERIDGDSARIAFWANLYNALVLHCLCLKPLRGSLLWHVRLFDRVAYRIGAHDYPLNLIENGILRVNTRAPLRLRRPLRAGDPRLAATPSRIDPRVHFALNCGARSCPPIRDYKPETVDALKVKFPGLISPPTALSARTWPGVARPSRSPKPTSRPRTLRTTSRSG